jgi:hypothetical protein
MPFRKCFLALPTTVLLTAPLVSQTPAPEQDTSANALGRAVINNELKSQATNHGNWMYQENREDQGKKKKTTEVVQTPRGSLERLLAVDDHPLAPNDQRQEEERIESLVRNPAEQQKREQIKRKEAEQCQAFFKTIPDAFNFHYAGREGDLIKLSYQPNPKFQAPSREARVLQAMEKVSCGCMQPSKGWRAFKASSPRM